MPEGLFVYDFLLHAFGIATTNGLNSDLDVKFSVS